MGRSISRRIFLSGTAAGAMTAAYIGGAEVASSSSAPLQLEEPVHVNDLSTPALLIDLGVMESNLQKMAAYLKSKNVGLRPHTKTHKCPIIAKKQIELGAVGVCAAKVSEAEVMVDAGIENVLITSPVVTPEKINRVVSLAKRSPGLQMVIDNAKTARDFADASEAAGTALRILIDLDTGTRRTGIAPGAPALGLLEYISKNCKPLVFDGLQAYAGHVMHVRGHAQRKQRSLESLEACLETKQLMEKAGYGVAVFSGGGTGTYDIDCDVSAMTDLQLGSYLFMDVQYRAIGDADSELFDEFSPSLFVLVTTISQPVEGLITVDAGYKAFATDSVKPEFRDLAGVDYNWGGDEHGICRITDPAREIKLGEKFEMIVSHCDPTVNLYDHYYPYRDGMVTELWPIAARGKSQ
ncbi:DSD1 family PLP-dependent enzyme [Candidatus Sumerlaeota bacterium]|nr:DSD1 family PLP-dependent enzyme [Candidatus Sumerlaeota bacterium]